MTRKLRVTIALSGAGHVLHNAQEFGLGTVFVSQTLLPAAVTVVLLAMARRPTRSYLRFSAAWALIVIVFGGASVLPLPLLPFAPAQTLSHYAAHTAYALLQLPLLATTWAYLRIPSHDRVGRRA